MYRDFLRRVRRFFDVNSTTGWMVLMVGGNYSNASYAGLFYFNANNSSSNANTNIGARHLVSRLNAQELPHRLVKILPLRTGLSRLMLERPCRQTRTEKGCLKE